MGAFPFESPFIDLRQGLAGALGTPSLKGDGSLIAGQPVTLRATGCWPFGPAYLVVSATDFSAPFAGGILVPHPDLLFGVTVDGFGEVSLGGPWPAGVPTGVATYFQYWIVDAGGPFGFSATNAVAGVAP